MQFEILMWLGSNDSVQAGTIFGVLDQANPVPLPMLLPGGSWAKYRSLDESRFKFARDAKRAIAQHGYYLLGASVAVTEAFGEPPK